MKSNHYILIFLMVGLSMSGCTKKKWSKTAEISFVYAATTNIVELAGKDFVLDELRVSFTQMELAGDRLQADYVSVSNTGTVDVDFMTNEVVGSSLLPLPQGTYDFMKMPLRVGGNGVISVQIGGDYFLPASVIYKVDIDLAIETYELLEVLDNDNETRILIEEGNARNLVLTMNPEILFAEVNPGLWNAAAITSISGTQTIVVDELNNQSVYYALLAGFSTALTAKFE